MPITASRALVRQTERWFVRHGVPQMIAGYDFDRHVLPRMLPFLALVVVADLGWVILWALDGTIAWVLLSVLVAAGLAGWSALTRFGRRLPHFSRPAMITVLVAYAVVPIAVPPLALWLHDGRASITITSVTAFALLLVASWLATSYGVVPLLRRAIRHAVEDMRNSVRLQGRALPLLLFVTLFFFFTGELWQAMNRLPWYRLGLVLTLFTAVTVLAAAGRLRDEIGRVEQDLSRERLSSSCQRTPLASLPIEEVAPDGPLRPVPLHGRQVGNLLLMLATRQLVQALVVGVGLFAFFLLLGLIVVQPETAEQWIGEPPAMLAEGLPVPLALLRNAALLAGFGSMYFAVTSMSDVEHRRQFFAPILDEVERTLAVRAVYLAVREIVLPGRTVAQVPLAPDEAVRTPADH
ncbi:hypothetical protein BDK92_5242 [Micromonospora pisi]|uniref:Uncharacterized protein n=1 Tax=Micromonospora pisi TaxID=589240 RepID=A0A495JQQ4_9ACTN|nr:hypothetical protein [Micromonospora pisi]RKR90858.1 hypothetical protein BDK92_5242 [Micromonospora pisi]